MCEPTLVAGLVISGVGAIQQARGQQLAAKAQSDAANFQAQVSQNNQILAERAAVDAEQRGRVEESERRLRTRQQIGSQRAGFAGAGVLVDSGSAGDITADTAQVGELDALTIRSNAAREALGFRSQGTQFGQDAQLQSLRADSARRAGRTRAFGTLLTGANNVSNKWLQFDAS